MRMSGHDSRTFLRFMIGVVLVVMSLSGVLMLGTITTVMAQSKNDYVGSETCKECHEVEYEQWKDSPMANAFADEAFQSEWQSQGSPSECLECHTTGFDAASGKYASEGVTCEACHEAGLTMTVNTSPELCGGCHTGSEGEHRYEGFLNGTHASSGVKCSDCHLYEKRHTFEIESKACAVCHTEDDIHDRRMILTLQGEKLEAADKHQEILADLEELQEGLEEDKGKATLITYVAYGGGALIVLVAVIVAVYYYKIK